MDEEWTCSWFVFNFVQFATELYDYGTSNGDTALPTRNDESVEMQLEQEFPYFSKLFNKVYVSIYMGYLSSWHIYPPVKCLFR